MAQRKNTTDLTELLLKGMAEPDPMLSMLEWLCAQLMEAEVSGLVGAEKNAQSGTAVSGRHIQTARMSTNFTSKGLPKIK